MWLHLQRTQSDGANAIHPRAGDKHSLRGQARLPVGFQGVPRGPDVQQHQEVDAAPGAQEGQDGRRWRRCSRVGGGVGGGVEGEKFEVAEQESFFSGSGVAERGEESHFRATCHHAGLEKLHKEEIQPLDVLFYQQTINLKTLEVLTEVVFTPLCNDPTPADAFCVRRERFYVDRLASEICRMEIEFLPPTRLGLHRFAPLVFQAKSWSTPAAVSSSREMLYLQPVEKKNQARRG